jgi:hypothetical protein
MKTLTQQQSLIQQSLVHENIDRTAKLGTAKLGTSKRHNKLVAMFANIQQVSLSWFV